MGDESEDDRPEPLKKSDFDSNLFNRLNFGMSDRKMKKLAVPGYEPADLEDDELIALNQTQVLEDRLNRLNSNIDRLEESIRNLKKYEERSSSVETIFTFSILSFTFVQATSVSISTFQGLFLLILFGGWALALGGKSLRKTTKNSYLEQKSFYLSFMLDRGITREDHSKIALFFLGLFAGFICVIAGFQIGLFI